MKLKAKAMKWALRLIILAAIFIIVILLVTKDTPIVAEASTPLEYWREAPPRPDGAKCWKLYVWHHGFMGVSCDKPL